MAAEKDSKGSKGKRDSMAWLEQKAADAQARIEKKKAETPRQLLLPGMTEVMRAMPNHIARSSLFAPVARGRKKMHDSTLLVSRGDAEIRFSGKQLDEAQADVWMHAMYLASKQPLGLPLVVNRAEFLRAIGRAQSGQNYEWLHRTMKELAFGMLVIEIKKPNGTRKLSIGRSWAFHLFGGFGYDSKTEDYTLNIDPRWWEMFDNREFALIDWDKCRQFGLRQDMAKALQRLVATSSNEVQRYALDWLKAKMEYSGRLWDFRSTLTNAIAELVRLDIIAKGRIEDSTKGKEQLVLWLPQKCG